MRNTRNSAPSSPPHTEAHTPSQMARPGSPLRDIGKPSNVVAIEAGRARNAEQAAGDQAAGRAADVDAGHRRKARERIEPVGEGQHHDHRHGDGHARQRAADHADERAGEQRQQIFPLRDVDEAVPEQVEHLEARPRAARQQHQQIALEHEDRPPPRCRPRSRRAPPSRAPSAAGRAPPAAWRRTARSRGESRAAGAAPRSRRRSRTRSRPGDSCAAALRRRRRRPARGASADPARPAARSRPP